MQPDVVTRFAPSPTGPLHLGHAYAALVAHALAARAGGRFLVRIEDIDTGRCRATFEAAIHDDLRWLGLGYPLAAWRQSTRVPHYQAVVQDLIRRGLAYPCFCTRRGIADEASRIQRAPHGPEGARYPGTCRHLEPAVAARRMAEGESCAIRLDVASCMATIGGEPLHFEETGAGPHGEHGRIVVEPGSIDDIVLARKDVGVSYHLAVVLDDHAQGITLVSRGNDLYHATPAQRLLQAVCGLHTPRYHHHPLVTDSAGRRLAKRDHDHALSTLREAGLTPQQVIDCLPPLP